LDGFVSKSLVSGLSSKLSVRRLFATALAAGVLASSSAILPTQSSAAEAAATPIYWGAYVNGAPFDMAPIDQFETRAGKKQSIVHWGEPWKMNGTMMGFQTEQMEKVRLRGQIPMLDWNSWNLGAPVDDPNFKLSRIYGGVYDAYITQWATDAKAWGHPFFIRFDHEMNGWWYGWSEQRNGNQPGDYVKAWRHVVDIFRKVGATNATWVWCINITDSRSTPIAQMYPGDNYVDWTAMDGYNKATDAASWFSFDQIFSAHPWSHKNTYGELVALAPSKPIMVAETATSKTGGDAGAWIKQMLADLPTKYPQVRALVWFNWNAGDASLAWPIESSAGQTAGFKAGIASSYYATNTFANLPAGPVKPIGGVVNSGPATSTPTATPTSTPTTSVTLKAVGDTYVDSANPTSTAGGPSVKLIADGDPYDAAYLRFDLSSLAGKSIASATLRIHTTNDPGAGSTGTFDLMYVADNTWNGYTMNLGNAPAISTTKLGSLVSPSANLTWYQAGLSATAVQSSAGGQLNLAVVPTNANGDGVIFNSKEGDTTLAPQLVVTYR
jgi:hypothetical protein